MKATDENGTLSIAIDGAAFIDKRIGEDLN